MVLLCRDPHKSHEYINGSLTQQIFCRTVDVFSLRRTIISSGHAKGSLRSGWTSLGSSTVLLCRDAQQNHEYVNGSLTGLISRRMDVFSQSRITILSDNAKGSLWSGWTRLHLVPPQFFSKCKVSSPEIHTEPWLHKWFLGRLNRLFREEINFIFWLTPERVLPWFLKVKELLVGTIKSHFYQKWNKRAAQSSPGVFR